MRVSINKLTGKLIEAQSGGETHPNPEIDNKEYVRVNLDVLLQNAVNAGYKKDEVEVKFVTDEEFEMLMETTKLPPTEEQLNEEKIQKRIRELAIESLKADGRLPVDYLEKP